MGTPIACTLSPGEASDRVEEWRRFLGSSVEASERTSARQLRLRLNPSSDVLVDAVDLAQREKACCAFFEFSIQIERDAQWLVVGVPTEASSILSDFARLLPSVSTSDASAKPE